jgi:hypothetical protein
MGIPVTPDEVVMEAGAALPEEATPTQEAVLTEEETQHPAAEIQQAANGNLPGQEAVLPVKDNLNRPFRKGGLFFTF